MSLNLNKITASIGIPYQQYVTSSAGHTLVSSSTYFNDTSDNLPRYKDANDLIYDPFITSSYSITASHALNAGGGGAAFPFTGDAQITGSLTISGSSENLISGSFKVVSPTRGTMLNIDANTFTIGPGASAGGGYTAVAIGSLASAANNYAVSIGAGSDTTTTYAIAIGGGATGAQATGQDGIAIGGNGTTASGNNSIAIGYSATNSGDYSINIGRKCRATGDNAITFNASGDTITAPSNTKAFNVFLSDGAGNPDFVISASNESKLSGSSFTVEKSGSTVFDVIGSTGTLFSVDDDLSGMLFTTNDISGLPVLQASASGETFIGKSPQSLYTTAVISATSASATASVYALSTSSYDGVFFDYTIISASNARAGSIMSVWNGGTITHTETTTTDIGTTAGIAFNVIISQSQAQLVAITDSTDPNTWKVKTIIKAI